MLNKPLKIFTSCFMGILISCSALANYQEIINKLKSARSDLEYKILGPSDIPGFFELQIGNDSNFYVSSDGKFLLDGDFSNVKESKFSQVRKIAMSKIDTDDLIIFRANNKTKAVINVFTDIDCGFCRKLHKEVPSLNALGVEVRYLAFPRAGLDSKSYQKALSAWCSDDPKESLTDYKNGDDKPFLECRTNAVAEQYRLGLELGISGTPAIILEDGSLVPGYRTAEALIKIIGLKT
jgi:thiol:disulfide interchange protein DsbC